MPGEATVTPLAPRLGAVSAAGGGTGGGGGGGQLGGRFRAERPAAPERQAVSERQAAPERPAMSHASASPGLPRPAHRDPVPPVPERPPGTAQVPVDPPDYFDDSERTWTTHQRPPVSEPQPDALDVRPEPEPLTATAPPAPAPPAGEPHEPRSAEAVTPAALPATARAEHAEPANEQIARPRPGKKNARGRRSSVPSWDEIMLGSSRQRD